MKKFIYWSQSLFRQMSLLPDSTIVSLVSTPPGFIVYQQPIPCLISEDSFLSCGEINKKYKISDSFFLFSTDITPSSYELREVLQFFSPHRIAFTYYMQELISETNQTIDEELEKDLAFLDSFRPLKDEYRTIWAVVVRRLLKQDYTKIDAIEIPENESNNILNFRLKYSEGFIVFSDLGAYRIADTFSFDYGRLPISKAMLQMLKTYGFDLDSLKKEAREKMRLEKNTENKEGHIDKLENKFSDVNLEPYPGYAETLEALGRHFKTVLPNPININEPEDPIFDRP